MATRTDPVTPWLGAALSATVVAAGCNAIFGLREGERAPDSGGAGGSTAASGGGGAGGGTGGAGGTMERPCNTSAECDDDNECTDDLCDTEAHICVHVPLDEVLPADRQVAGDCKVALCSSGVLKSLAYPEDIPDDGSSCTHDECLEGIPANAPLGLGTPCVDPLDPAAKLCDAGGKCVVCVLASDCSLLQGDDCNVPECQGGACKLAPVASGTAVNETKQKKGDCQLVQCDGQGGTKSVADDTDKADDGNPCTIEGCTGGQPTSSNATAGTPCGAGSQCDGMGSCGCASDGDCPTDTFCRDWSCNLTTKTCQPADTADGTPLPPAQQTGGDCQQKQCDGAGGVKSVALALDVPPDDGKECTSESCSGGTPQHPPKPINTPCAGSTKYCDGQGACVQCNNASQCPAAPNCQDPACENKQCAVKSSPAGTPSDSQVTGDCKTAVCDGNGNVSATPQVNDNDLPVDGKQCTEDKCSAGTPSNPAAPAYTACTEDGGQVCDGGGACVQCLDNAQCTMGSCDPATHTCSGGLGLGAACSGGAECMSGFCVDGVCCDGACTQTCHSCNVGNHAGTCSPDPDGTMDPGCAVNEKCNGMGMCVAELKPLGAPCAGGAECMSGFCVDGVCCNSDCAGACRFCNPMGMCQCMPAGFMDPLCFGSFCNGMCMCMMGGG